MGKRVRAAINALKIASEASTATSADIDMYNAHATNYAFTEGKAGKTIRGKIDNSIFNPKIGFKVAAEHGRAGLKLFSSDENKRENFRASLTQIGKPFSNTAQKLTTADKMMKSGDPNVVAAGRVLRAKADQETLKIGKRAIAVGAVVIGAAALGGTASAGVKSFIPSATTMGKTLGTLGINAMTAKNKKKEAATGGLADTSDGNGDGMDPITGRRYQDYMSEAAGRFFKTGGAAATGGGAASCGMVGSGEPWLLLIGILLFGIGMVFYRRHRRGHRNKTT